MEDLVPKLEQLRKTFPVKGDNFDYESELRRRKETRVIKREEEDNEVLAKLKKLKAKAIEDEEYELAKVLAVKVNEAEEIVAKIKELKERKLKAIEEEDFGLAKECKVEMKDLDAVLARLGGTDWSKHVGQEGADGDGKKAAEAVFVSDELAKLLEDYRLSRHGPGMADAGYEELGDLVDAEEDEISDLSEELGMKKPECRRLKQMMESIKKGKGKEDEVIKIKQRGVMLTVLYSFTGEQEGELTVAKGDTVFKAPDPEVCIHHLHRRAIV